MEFLSHTWQPTLIATLRATTAAPGGEAQWSRIGGNAHASVWSLHIASLRYFVKLAARAHASMLAAEAEALLGIAATGALRVPMLLARGETGEVTFLVLEWLDIVDGGRDAALGAALAKLHDVTASRFGWHRDNTIGTAPQSNTWCADWATFFRDQRLAPQLALAVANGFDGRLQTLGEKLLANVNRLLADHQPRASLLHGDMWSGNTGRLADGTPIVFDPASYYGDREADLAMCELFGGFSPSFYSAYREAAPLPSGYPLRRTLYNLYHVLNHLNLFGASYLARAERMMIELVGER